MFEQLYLESKESYWTDEVHNRWRFKSLSLSSRSSSRWGRRERDQRTSN